MLGGMSDISEIEQLKYRYVRLLDTKQWDEFATCFSDDATADYAGLSFTSPGDLVDYMRTNLPDTIITMHHLHHPEITVDGDQATGRWYLYDKVFAPAFEFALEGAAFYQDRYVRTPQGWRIAHTGYERTWELTTSLKDQPHAKFTGPGGPATHA
jgi:hypothetical protein